MRSSSRQAVPGHVPLLAELEKSVVGSQFYTLTELFGIIAANVAVDVEPIPALVAKAKDSRRQPAGAVR